MLWLKFNRELLTKKYHSLLLKSLDLVIYLEAKKKSDYSVTSITFRQTIEENECLKILTLH